MKSLHEIGDELLSCLVVWRKSPEQGLPLQLPSLLKERAEAIASLAAEALEPEGKAALLEQDKVLLATLSGAQRSVGSRLRGQAFRDRSRPAPSRYFDQAT